MLMAMLMLMLISKVDRALAHSADELDEWVVAWVIDADTALDPQLIEDWVDMVARHPYYFDPQPEPSPRASTSTARGMGTNVEQWRSLVAAHFPADQVDRALCIMSYESGGNQYAQNPHSSAAGLFQIMGFWWDTYGGNRYDPETNVTLARIIYNQQGWNAWNPYKRGLCH